MPEPVCALEHVYKDYKMGEVAVPALVDVSITVNAADFLAFAGPSGSGKTTLLNLVGLLDVPTRGKVLLRTEAGEPRDAAMLSPGERDRLRARHIGFIFQQFNLVPVLSALENVELALRLSGGQQAGSLSRQQRRERSQQALADVGLGELADRYPSQLSGGQQQRVAIARALVKRPTIVIADEPTANLDTATGEAILDIMSRLNRERGTTFLISTHDPRVIDHARRVVRLCDGRIVRDLPGGQETDEATKASPAVGER